MNLLDMVIAGVVILFALKGLFRGLINEFSSLVGLALGGWMAWTYYSALALPIRKMVNMPAPVASFAAFVIILLCTGILAHIAGNVVTSIARAALLGGLNRIGGFCLGAAEGAVLLSLVFSIMSTDAMPPAIRGKVASSPAASALAAGGSSLLSIWKDDKRKAP